MEYVENTVYPVTTVAERDTHKVLFVGKTVTLADKVKFVESLDCGEEATEYEMEEFDDSTDKIYVATRVLFTKKVPTLHVCYKFGEHAYTMLEDAVSLLYLSTVEPGYVIAETDSILYLTGQGVEMGYVQLSDTNDCKRRFAQAAVAVDAFGRNYVEVNVAEFAPLLYVCFRYATYNEKYHFTGEAVEMFGLDSASESKWLVNLPLPSPGSVNEEGLVLFGHGLMSATVKLVKAKRNCMALGTVLALNETTTDHFVAEPFTMTEVGDYKFCVQFGERRFISYDHVEFSVEEYVVSIEGYGNTVSIVKGDEATEKSLTFNGGVRYFQTMEMKLVKGGDCASEPAAEVAVRVTDYTAVLTVASGVAVPIQICMLKGEEFVRLPIELYLKELTTIRVEAMENQLKLTDGSYTVNVAGPYVGAGDMLRYVSAGSSCTEPSVLTYAVRSDMTTTLVIPQSMTVGAWEACYKFAGETEYVKYASKTLSVFIVSGVSPSMFVLNAPTTTTLSGVGFAAGDKVWFARDECGAAPANAVTVEDATAVVLTVTSAAVNRMCYEFVNFGVVMVPTPIVVFSATALSHASWLTTVPLPTAGFSVAGVADTTPLTVTGSNFSISSRVKFVMNAEGCTGVSTDPIQIVTVTESESGQTAELMPVVFSTAGVYYLCIVHDPTTSVYTHYPLTVTVKATAIETELNDAKMFVLSEEPIADEVEITADFLDLVSGEITAVWTESVCSNYVLTASIASIASGASQSARRVSSQFTRAYNSLNLCLRLPGDYFVASRVRKVFKTFTVLESPTPFVSSTVSAIPFTLQGQNLKVDDKIAFVQSAACDGVNSGITVNSGSVTVSLPENAYDFFVCYQFSEFGAASPYHLIPMGSPMGSAAFSVTVYRLDSVSFTTLVQDQTQSLALTMKGGKVLPDGVTVRVISAAGSCTSLAAGVDAVVASGRIEVTPSNDVVFDAENQVCMRMSEASPFFGFKKDVVLRFARVTPLEDPLFLLTGLEESHAFSLQASAADAFTFVPATASCDSANAVAFTLEEGVAKFTVAQGFNDYKLCYNFAESAGFFAFDGFRTYVLPAEESKLVAAEVATVYRKASATQTIVTYLLRAMDAEKAEKELILDASSALVQEEVSLSAKVMAVLYGMNLDINAFAVRVVKEMNATQVAPFVGSYASQVAVAYSSGNSENPQKLLLQMMASVNGDQEKMREVLEGWRSTASSAEKDVSTSDEVSLDFSDGSSVSFSPVSSSRRLAESEAVSVKVNKFQCFMIDVDITEGFCYEVLINGSTMNELEKPMRLTYDKRDKDDTHCASKADLTTVGWTEREADNNSDCFFSNGKAAIEGVRFGVVTTHKPTGAQPAKINPKALSVVLVMAIVIFVLLFIGLSYTLWVYVHPAEPVDVDSMWAGFAEERQKNLEEKRKERAERKRKLLEMENAHNLSDEEYSDYSDYSYSDSDSDGGDLSGEMVNSVYDDLMARPSEVREDGDYDTAIRSANESSMYAQNAAENTDIVPDMTMERDADIGEVRRE